MIQLTGHGPLEEAQQRRGGGAVYAAVLAVLTLAMTGVVGLLLKQPWLFPSLGPTVMLFFESPKQPASRPLNTIVGHLVGIAAGLVCYTGLGLSGHPSAPVGGLTVSYVIAGALAVGITTAALSLLKLPHPPAGASTLIVALGILHTPAQLLSMVGAVLLITGAGWAFNRLLLGKQQ
ncbi:MAG: HPP family protein [Cryobacterium sp.]|uniref:HPP family protein n=1 Tax=unclassified Cryobacterium TaxID=2649013 RepID=UPI0018CA6B1A|nr:MULTISPECIES: HPP family protein [unclassified Cryobacterium]MCY7404417.1 HPP family protein [Cryobacterium sp.]MEC5155775.1 CBS-domain-containing membrane protein [Cryobacterium sp. CAN_C3]